MSTIVDPRMMSRALSGFCSMYGRVMLTSSHLSGRSIAWKLKPQQTDIKNIRLMSVRGIMHDWFYLNIQIRKIK